LLLSFQPLFALFQHIRKPLKFSVDHGTLLCDHDRKSHHRAQNTVEPATNRRVRMSSFSAAVVLACIAGCTAVGAFPYDSFGGVAAVGAQSPQLIPGLHIGVGFDIVHGNPKARKHKNVERLACFLLVPSGALRRAAL
jgi:hypothetical protein